MWVVWGTCSSCASFALSAPGWCGWGVGGRVLCDLNSGREHLAALLALGCPGVGRGGFQGVGVCCVEAIKSL